MLRTALTGQLLVKLYTKLLDGRALSFEELVDVLTLKDNVEGNESDAAKALELFVRSSVSPPHLRGFH